MNQVHAPYHFVPLSQWVYSPEWAHLVSHDHPFREGLSGTLHYELTNQTPLLVGGDQDRKANQPAQIKWSCDPDGKPVIPGSSLKGMIRNVLEIATFAKFKQVDDSHFAFRDISSSDSRYAKKVLDSKTVAYWLSYDAARQGWTLRESRFTVLFTDDFNRYSGKQIHNEPFKQTAKDKYSLWPLTSKAIPFTLGSRTMLGTKGHDVTVACASSLGKSDAGLVGYPVFTGSRPGAKDFRDSRLNFNYFFYEADSEARLCDGQYLELVHKMFAAHDEDLVDYLKKHPHPELGIPLFVKQKAGKPLAMGFAQMPKMLYDRSIGEVASHQQPGKDAASIYDFPELLFGTLSHSGFSLKSRVSFVDAVCKEDKGRKFSNAVILGQPKASYLGAYLEQKANATGDASNSNLSQYDATSRLSGWKRYPAQTGFSDKIPEELRSKVNVQSQLELMAPQSRFTGKIVFHNLKAEELGALIWALSPDAAQASRFHHSLGHGKSLGAGAVQFRNLQLTLRHEDTASLDDLREGFVSHMNSVYPATTATPDGWSDSAQIRHLLAFGDRADNDSKPLEYMLLNNPRDKNAVTYTSSMKGRDKKVLPTWRAQGTPLPRDEAVTPPAVNTGRGRLRDLLHALDSEDRLSNWEQQQQQQAELAAEKAAQAAVQAAAQAEENALRSTLSPLGLQLYDLYAELKLRQGRTDVDSQNFRTGRAVAIDRIIQEYHATTPLPEQREARMLYDMATDMTLSGYFDQSVKPKDLSKKQKERYLERKQLLASLCETFALPGGKH